MIAAKNRSHSRQEFIRGIGLDNVSLCPVAQSCLYHVLITVLGYEDYLCAGNELADTMRSFQPINVGNADV